MEVGLQGPCGANASRSYNGIPVALFVSIGKRLNANIATRPIGDVMLNQPPVKVLLLAPSLTAWGLARLLETAQPALTLAGCVGRADEGVAHLAAEATDIVVVDLESESGEDAVPRLHGQTSARIVVLTGSPDPLASDRAVMNGARGVVHKREAPPVLLRAIEKVHAGQIWVDREATGRIFMELARHQREPKATDPMQARLGQLTPRERQTLEALLSAPSLPAKRVAVDLHISENTLRNHLTSIYAKLDVANRAELFSLGLRMGLVRAA